MKSTNEPTPKNTPGLVDQTGSATSNGTLIHGRGIRIGLEASWELDALLELALDLNSRFDAGGQEAHECALHAHQMRGCIRRMQQLSGVLMGVIGGDAAAVGDFERDVRGREPSTQAFAGA